MSLQSVNRTDKLQRLSQLLLLEQKARQKLDSLELGFEIVNSTHKLSAYKRCVYWKRNGRKVKCVHASGVSKIDTGSPFHKHYTKVIKKVIHDNSKKTRENWARLTEIKISNLPEQQRLKIQTQVSENFLVIEFISPKGQCFAGMTIESDRPFSESDKSLLEHVCESYAHALYSLYAQRRNTTSFLGVFFKNKMAFILTAAFIAAMFLPIKSSVTVPAEIIARDPYIISAPVEGILKELTVETNQRIEQGQKLAIIDDTEIRNKLEIALREREVLEADLEQSSRQAFTEKKSKAQIAIIRGKIQRKKAEIQFLREILGKTIITSPTQGIALFNDPNKIRGQIFQTGQKIMLIANPEKIELKIRIPAEGIIKFDVNEPIDLYLNETPLISHSAKLDYLEYHATTDPDGLLTYKAYAQIDEKLPIGARGSVKIYGFDTTLGEQIFRRPIAILKRHIMW